MAKFRNREGLEIAAARRTGGDGHGQPRNPGGDDGGRDNQGHGQQERQGLWTGRGRRASMSPQTWQWAGSGWSSWWTCTTTVCRRGSWRPGVCGRAGVPGTGARPRGPGGNRERGMDGGRRDSAAGRVAVSAGRILEESQGRERGLRARQVACCRPPPSM